MDRTIKLKLDLSEYDKEMPYDVLAIEDLTSIRVQSRTKGVKFTKKLNNWSFYQLKQFLIYKAEAFGKSGDSRRTVTAPYIACDDAEARKGIDAEHSYNAPHLIVG